MKKLLLITGIVICTFTLRAQPGTISLNLDAGYTFHDKVNFDAAYTDVQAAFQYGGGIEYFKDFNKSIEIKYLRMDTYFPLYKQNGERLNPENEYKGSVNYVLFGVNNYFGPDPDAKARPYGGIGLGIGILGVENGTTTNFAWNARLGVKIKASPVVSIKLQAHMQSIVAPFGTDLWSSGGYTYAVPDWATLWQFGFEGILCFDFKR
jgi:opacity protein-like surface antigen